MTVMTQLKIQRAKGYLADYYLCKQMIQFYEFEIEYCREKLGIKAISYDKEPQGSAPISRDSKLLNMIEKIDSYEEKIKKYKSRLNKYHTFDLSENDLEMLDMLFVNLKTYEEIGKELGFSKAQVYRMLLKIYEKVFDYIEEAGI